MTNVTVKKGNCYEAAGRFFMDEALSNPNLVLVHGEVSGQGPLKGMRFGHAWVEEGDLVIDKANGKDLRLPKELYYAVGQIDKTFRYNYVQFIEKVLGTGHWGPWESELTWN